METHTQYHIVLLAKLLEYSATDIQNILVSTMHGLYFPHNVKVIIIKINFSHKS